MSPLKPLTFCNAAAMIRIPGPTSPPSIRTPPAIVMSISPPGRSDFYRVAASNAAGTSTFSNIDDARPLLLVRWLEDDFDAGLGSMWSSVSAGSVVNGGKGFRGSAALWFGQTGTRVATTLPVDTMQGALVEFQLRAGNSAVDGPEYWDNSETGDTVVLE